MVWELPELISTPCCAIQDSTHGVQKAPTRRAWPQELTHAWSLRSFVTARVEGMDGGEKKQSQVRGTPRQSESGSHRSC